MRSWLAGLKKQCCIGLLPWKIKRETDRLGQIAPVAVTGHQCQLCSDFHM